MCCLVNRPAVATRLLELRVFDIVLAELRKLGRPAVSVLGCFELVLVSWLFLLLMGRMCVPPLCRIGCIGGLRLQAMV